MNARFSFYPLPFAQQCQSEAAQHIPVHLNCGGIRLNLFAIPSKAELGHEALATAAATQPRHRHQPGSIYSPDQPGFPLFSGCMLLPTLFKGLLSYSATHAALLEVAELSLIEHILY